MIEIQEKDLRKVAFRKQPDDVRIFIPMEENINKNFTHYHQLVGWYICMWGPLPGRPSGRYRGVYPAFIEQLRKEEKEAAKKKETTSSSRDEAPSSAEKRRHGARRYKLRAPCNVARRYEVVDEDDIESGGKFPRKDIVVLLGLV